MSSAAEPELTRIRRALEGAVGRASETQAPHWRTRAPYIGAFLVAALPPGAAGGLASGGYVIDASTLPIAGFGGGTVTEAGILTLDLESLLGAPSATGHVVGVGDPVPDLLARCQGIREDTWTGWYRIRTDTHFTWDWPTARLQIANIGALSGIAQVLAR